MVIIVYDCVPHDTCLYLPANRAQREDSARLHDGDFSKGHSHSQHQDPAKKSSLLDLNPSLRTTRAGVRFASSVGTSSSTSQDDRDKPLISWASSR